jgi:hypothetical protein
MPAPQRGKNGVVQRAVESLRIEFRRGVVGGWSPRSGLNRRPTPYQGVRREAGVPSATAPSSPNSREGRYAGKCTSPPRRCATPHVLQTDADQRGPFWTTFRATALASAVAGGSGDITLVCAGPLTLEPLAEHTCDVAGVHFGDDLRDKVRGGLGVTGLALIEDELRVTRVITYEGESDFDRSVRAAAEPLANTTKGVGVGLRGGRLVILAPVVDLP